MRRTVLLAAVLSTVAAAPAHAAYPYSISRITPAVKARIMGVSYHTGCPVPLRNLRYVRLRYRDFRHRPRTGELIVNRDAAGSIVRVFRRLYANGYGIRRMRLVDAYGGSDYRSIEADNTSAFNCRFVDGTTRWSNHAFGRAVDVNPLENPFVSANGTTSHPRSRRYVDRTRRRHPAMILRGDRTVRAFASQGWGWGGNFSGAKDYQHFSADGR
jgi:D-alanyl-D-alanine carboxypeptidase